MTASDGPDGLKVWTLPDGSTIGVADTGRYDADMHFLRKVIRCRITNADGEVLFDEESMRASPMETEPAQWAESFLAFIGHDAEIHEFTTLGSWGRRYPNSEGVEDLEEIEDDRWTISPAVGAWADSDPVKYELQTLQAELDPDQDGGFDDADKIN